MREWMFGTITGWIDHTDYRGDKKNSILEALGSSRSEMNFVYLFDGDKLVGVCRGDFICNKFNKFHQEGYEACLDGSDSAPCDVTYRIVCYYRDHVKDSNWGQLDRELTALALTAMNEEKNDEQSN